MRIRWEFNGKDKWIEQSDGESKRSKTGSQPIYHCDSLDNSCQIISFERGEVDQPFGPYHNFSGLKLNMVVLDQYSQIEHPYMIDS